VFTREHLLNVAVNVIPLFIIAFFLVLFLVFEPWGFDPLDTGLMVGLHLVPLVSLIIVSYIAVKHVEVDEPREGIGVKEEAEYEGPTEEMAAERHHEEVGAHAGEDSGTRATGGATTGSAAECASGERTE